MLLHFAALRWRVPAFDRNFNRLYQEWQALDFSRMPPHELMRTYREMERKLLRKWKTPIINDFHVMIFYGTLKACCQKWCGDDKATLQNNLICGEGGIASTEPTRMLMKLATEIKSNPQVQEFFLKRSPAELATEVPDHPACREIAETVNRYLQLYGFRCINELKLEEPSLHETPEFVYQMLINYIGMSAELLDVETMAARERKIRGEAEALVTAKLTLPRRLLFNFVLKQARRGVKNRENLRFARTRIYGRIRQLLNAVGQSLVKEQIIQDDQDIYYLTMEEVWDYIKGTAVTTDLSALIELRKAEFTRYRDEPADISDHFDTYGMAYNRNAFVNHLAAEATLCEDGLLHGIGCSPGCATGTARVVHSPKDNMRLNGEILVASRTDPGWVVLYPSVSGILIERGSILSHSAIVAREMGIPAIVGIPGLLDVVKDGSHLEMDATAGTVKQCQ
ncbi:MAG: PEP-utilizing enzyme [Kiritimatiellae bacterium]|nr:PEP-utilizing enzyme [Kiritimatiellia bacterium]